MNKFSKLISEYDFSELKKYLINVVIRLKYSNILMFLIIHKIVKY